jgi:CHAT domain-containing protein/tetratricopeptide (TPR) repeat protein
MRMRLQRGGVSAVVALALVVLAGRAVGADPGKEDLFAPINEAMQEGRRELAHQRAADLERRARGAPARLTEATVLNQLGQLFLGWADYDAAEDYFAKMQRVCVGLDAARDISVPREARPEYPGALRHLYIATAELNLGLLYFHWEKHIEAGRHNESAEQELDAAGAADSRPIGRATLLENRVILDLNRGLLVERAGQYEEAEKLYQQALARYQGPPEKLPRDAQLLRAKVINSRGWLQVNWGNHLRTKAETARTPAEAERLRTEAQEKYRLAERDVRDAQATRERLAAGAVLLAQSENNLALVLYLQGKDDPAEPLFLDSLNRLKAAVGPNHPDAARYEHNLAALYRTRGAYPQAEALYRESVQALGRVEGASHPDVSMARAYRAWLRVAEGAWTGAAEEMQQARQIYREHIRRVVSARGESEQLAFLQTKDRPQYDAALTLGYEALLGKAGAHPTGDQARLVAEESAEWLLNGKGITAEVLGARAALVRDPAHAGAQAAYKDLCEVRDDLAARALLRSDAKGPQRAFRDCTPFLRREARLSQAFALKLGNLPSGDWVEAADVQRFLARALAGRGVLIDIARYAHVDFARKGNDFLGTEERYAAWVVPPAGADPVRVFDLGSAAEVDAAVDALHDEMERAYHGDQPTLELGDARSEALFRARSKALADLLLARTGLYAYVGKYPRWVVSPDSKLWQVPWSALVLPGGDKAGTYAVEKHTISLVSSGRDLVRFVSGSQDQVARLRVRRSDPLVLADPDLGRAPPGQGTRLQFGELKLARTEAEAVAPLLAQYTHTDNLQPLVGEDARERVFRQAHSPKAVFLGTHGFFREQKDDLPANPFLRCGLVLAGANQLEAHRPSAEAARDDGYLLGEEILDTDLRGTDLVVMSACETAAGTTRGAGEGMASLQSAFQMAGAQSVVATLWEVEDGQTALLMVDFLSRLAGQKEVDKAEALRQAQLKRIAALKADPRRGGTAHPFFWAALTLTGQWAGTLR